MELIGKLASNYTSKIEIFPSVSKDVSVKFSDKCINIINNKEVLNGLKGSQKCKINNHHSNINHVYKMFKRTLVLITEV